MATSRQCGVWLRSVLRRDPWRAAFATLFAVVAAAAIIVPVYVLGRLVDDVLAGAPTSRIVMVIVQIGIAAIAAGLLSGAATYLMCHVGETVLANLRERALEHALLLPVRTVERAGKGDLLSRVNDDVAAIARVVGNAVPASFSSLTLAGLSFVAIFSIDYRLGLGALVSVPLGLAVLLWYLPRSGPMFTAERVALSARSQALVSGMQGLPTVHAYGLEKDQISYISDASSEARDQMTTSFRELTRFVARGKLVQYIGLAAVLGVSFLLVRDGQQISVGEATIAALLFHRLFLPMQGLLFSFNDIQAAGESLRRLVGLINSEMVRESGTSALPEDSRLELRNLEFSYDGVKPVLHGVTITLEPGERVALVGSTGAGKTTVAAIAAGSITPNSGTARIGGVNLGDLGVYDLRRHVVIISQEVHVFSGPLFEDLRLANRFADHDALYAALRQVGALGWVEALPEGIATMVGEGGYQLSAAQAQQIALARLVLADAPVAILDEATAEAGSAGARELEHYAYEVMKGRTALIVAHRLTQAARADRVVVLEEGRVVEEGPHKELLQRGGRYAELWEAWEGRSPA
ncbi:Putative ABC transporter permease/ATP-binding protein [Hoyosella subflava DQS3-9A1]|uniref:Putative ABC transporter permease/ATP-binding protein n=1 Tax=Hoyosella subflava (strain DSM 45089 / JCM 17490 / NBRC 109087 / DQS3-9A1) TaxID=443218 RepID=F6EKE3_HOYSD|nr:Putative ABC transporter permease/ATP-binding protein [Hoyosella subflava DQS3-9A1]